jgi:hypothetical protein
VASGFEAGAGGGGDGFSGAGKGGGLRDRSSGPLGDDRAEAIVNAALQALGVTDRSDLTLVGVRGNLRPPTPSAKRGAVPLRPSVGGSFDAPDAGSVGSSGGSLAEGGREGGGPPMGEPCALDACVFEQGPSEAAGTGSAARSPNTRPAVVELPCGLLLSCHNLDVRASLFAALNGCGLAFDGKLVVDPRTMATSDPRILAGGDCTKFGRQFAAASSSHVWHHPGDVGGSLAARVLDVVNPARAAPLLPQAAYGALPAWPRPRTVSCALPGGLRYARSRTAAAASPKLEPTGSGSHQQLAPGLEAVATAMAAGRFLGSDGASASSASVVKLDGHGRIVELSYVGPGLVEARNWGNLVGLHSNFAGQCAAKHRRGEVTDWAAFFRADWAQALYHDRAGQGGGDRGLVATLRQKMRSDDAARDVLALMKRTLESASGAAPRHHGSGGGRSGASQGLASAGGSEGVGDLLSGALAAAIGVEGEKVGPGATKRIEGVLFEWMGDNKTTLPVFKVPERKEPAT